MHIREAVLAPQAIGANSLLSRLPQALRERPQWCVAAPDKRPLMTNGRAASVTDPSTWTDFESACRAAQAEGRHVGFVLTTNDPFTCIDLDVKDNTPAEHIVRFDRIISTFDSYTERSMSGRGFHVWLEGKIGRGRKRDGIEVYSQERFIICTGDVVRDCAITNRQDILTNMVSRMEPPPQGIQLTGDDTADYAVAARAVEDPGELGRLYRGNWEGRYPSQSEADLALVKLLIPLTDSLLEAWRTFQWSKLGERKKANRLDYAQSTVALAVQHLANDATLIEHGRQVAASILQNWQAHAHNQRHFRLLCDGDLDQLPPLRWLVKGIIPDAGIGAIYGDSGTFKSFLILDALAHISNGRDWFGRRVRAAPAIYVPFEGQGGVPNRIKAWRMAAQRNPNVLYSATPSDSVRSHVAVIVEPMNLRERGDRDKLVATLTENGWAGGVLCIDTLAHASNGIDENSSAMGEMLAIFRELQHRLGGVILVVHHSGKDQSKGMRGWSGLHAAMDFVLECQHDKGAGHRSAKFVLTKVKDGATGMAFNFSMQVVQLGFDEDDDPITSLAVCATTDAVDPTPNAKASKKGIREIDAMTSAADDQFIWQWVAQEVTAGNFPSKNSLKGQLPDMKQTYEVTQDRVAGAVERLLADGRLEVEKVIKSSNGNVWIRPLKLPEVPT